MIRTAQFSPCRNYRYILTREWNPNLPPFMVIGLNPSTADENRDDPTIRRCIGFAFRERCGSLIMTNLFGWRDKSPAAMKKQPNPLEHEKGANFRAISEQAAKAKIVVAAWGIHGNHKGQDVKLMLEYKGPIQCFGFTDDGHPYHPLFLPKNQPLQDYRAFIDNAIAQLPE